MAKRAPVDEKPYNPVEDALVRSVWLGENSEDKAIGQERRALLQQDEMPLQTTAIAETGNGTKGVTLPRSERAGQVPTHAFARGKQAREKRVLLTHTEERQIELLVHRLAIELATPVKLSHVLRACVAILQHADHEIVEGARKAPPLTRPPNGSPEALAEFEHRLAQILLDALQRSIPLR
jgi:hypothetical protein